MSLTVAELLVKTLERGLDDRLGGWGDCRVGCARMWVGHSRWPRQVRRTPILRHARTRASRTRYVIGGVKIGVRWYFVDLALIARLNAADVTHDVCGGQQADVELGSAASPYCGAAHTGEYPAPPAPPVS